MKAVIHLKFSNELDLNDGNLWSVVVSRTKNDGEDVYHSTDTSMARVMVAFGAKVVGVMPAKRPVL